MKKAIVLLLMLMMLLTGCGKSLNQSNDEENNKDIAIYSVDGALGYGRLTCENDNESLYVDGTDIYLQKADGSEEIFKAGGVNDSTIIEYVGMNREFIFYADSNNQVYSIDRKNKNEKLIDHFDISGIKSVDDKVYAYSNSFKVLELKGDKTEEVLDGVTPYEYNEYVYSDQASTFVVKLSGEEYTLRTAYDPVFAESGWLVGGDGTITPGHTVVSGDSVYLLAQSSESNNAFVDPDYKNKKNDALIKYDPKSDEKKLLYKTNDNNEQIVNYSIDNDELFLYSDGVIYRSNLYGEDRTKLCDAPSEGKLYFEYSNDQLFIYDEKDNLLGRY